MAKLKELYLKPQHYTKYVYFDLMVATGARRMATALREFSFVFVQSAERVHHSTHRPIY